MTANQQRATTWWMNNHPGFIPQTMIAGSIIFRHKEAGEEITRRLINLETEYTNAKNEERAKSNKKRSQRNKSL